MASEEGGESVTTLPPWPRTVLYTNKLKISFFVKLSCAQVVVCQAMHLGCLVLNSAFPAY